MMKSDESKLNHQESADPSANAPLDLPNFDVLVKMAKEDPEGLESLRRSLAEDLIQQASKDSQRKLRGLQFKIDMERRRAKTPMGSCIKLSEMMQNSFLKLRDSLNELSQIKEKATPSIVNTTQPAKPEPQVTKPRSATVVPFPS